MYGSWNPAQWKRMTTSGIVKTGQAQSTGILCTESSTAIINVYDGTTTGGTKVLGPLSLAAGNPYAIPAKLGTGIYVELVSGSGSWTYFYD